MGATAEEKVGHGDEDQEQDRSSESLATFAPRPQVRSALAQKFLRNSARPKPTSNAERPSSLSYLALTTNSREAVCGESCTGVQCVQGPTGLGARQSRGL